MVNDNNSREVILPIQSSPSENPSKNLVLSTKDTREYKYINCDDKKEMNSLFSDSSSGSSENKNNGKYLSGEIVNEAKKEIAKYIKDNALKSLRLRVRRSVKTALTARIVLDDKGEINISDFLASDFCKQRKITAVTLLLPDDEKRGIRGQIGENGEKIYEVIKGLYQMTLTWCVGKEECEIKVHVHDDGSVKLIEGNGVTKDQLDANKVKIKIGKQCEKSLSEALASQLQLIPQLEQKGSSAVVKALPPTNLTNMGTPEKHNPASGRYVREKKGSSVSCLYILSSLHNYAGKVFSKPKLG